MLARLAKPLVLLLTVLALVGCDDVALIDVSDSGKVLVAADAKGLAPLTADAAKRSRHLFWVDPQGGEVERITAAPLHLAWPRACGDGVLFVEQRSRLVFLPAQGARKVIYRSKRKLYQPLVSPTGKLILVLEAKQLGVSGRLVVLDRSGKVRQTFENCLLGAAFTDEGALVLPRSQRPRTTAFDSGPGEIVRVELGGKRRERVLFRGTVPAATNLTPAGGQRLVALLHLEGKDGPLGLAQLSAGHRGAKRGQTGVFDFWPTVEPKSERVLFTRSDAADPQALGELRVAPLERPSDSSLIKTPAAVAAPRWVGPDRVAFLTKDSRLVIQDLNGSNRLDMTDRLRAAFASEEPQ